MKFKYLISDMDGVLLDTERLILEMYIKSAQFHGFEFPESEFIKTIGIDTPGTRLILEKHIPIDYDVYYDTREKFLIERLTFSGAPIKDTVPEGLAILTNAGVKAAIATSTFTERAKLRLNKTGLEKYFDTFVYGNEIENGKPAPDIFLLAAQRLNAKPEDCVVFEDSPAGIASAKSAGMHAVLIPDMKEPDEELIKTADFVAKDFISAARYVLS